MAESAGEVCEPTHRRKKIFARWGLFGRFERRVRYSLGGGFSVAARPTKSDLTSSTSDSDRSSRHISEFRAAWLTRMSSSSLRWIALVSRFWVVWILHTIRNVMMLGAVWRTG